MARRKEAAEATPWAESPQQEWTSLAPAVGDTGASSAEDERPAAPSEKASQGPAPTQEEAPAPQPTRAAARPGKRRRPEGTANDPDGPAESVDAAGSTATASETSSGDAESSLTENSRASRRARARETALEDRPRALGLRKAVITAAVPLATLMLAVRAVATPAFLWLVYRLPWFPEDSFGFTREDRMVYGSHGMDYILNLAPARYLSELTDGDGARIFTTPEVSHMTDVKHVMLWALALVGLLVLLAAACSKGLRTRAPGAVSRALFLGAWITVVLLVVLGVLGVLGWERLFIGFHEVFFSGGNWAFRRSDTLIRLYPDEYWTASALGVVVIALLVSAVLLALTWPTRSRRERRLRAMHERQQTRERLRG